MKPGRLLEAKAAIEHAMTVGKEAQHDGLMSPEFQRSFGKILTQPESMTFRDIDGLSLMLEAVETSCPDDVVGWEEIGNTAAAAGRMDIACDAYRRATVADGSVSP
jgi:hypothetical protein